LEVILNSDKDIIYNKILKVKIERVGGKIINLQKNKIMIFVVFICILFLNLDNVYSSSNTIINNEKNNLFNTTLIDIDVTSITDGIGLDIIIKNNGNSDVENVILEFTINDRSIVILKDQYEISYLSAGESTSIHINLFGFNIGLIKDYAIISFLILYDDTIIIEGEISARIIGPFISIIGIYFDKDRDDKGYILYCPMWSTTTYLITQEGKVAHTWGNSIYQDSQSTYLLENGNLVRASLVTTSSFITGGYQGRVEIFDWNDSQLWNFQYSTFDYCSHHDIQPLPNGNILLIAWERLTKNEAINAGRNPNKIPGEYFWSDYIVEVEPIGNSEGIVVWEWHAWDHLIQDFDEAKENYGSVADNPELIDINSGGSGTDWLHTNSIDYNSELDQILLSVHNFNEIWIIDHSTTIEEAANHTGGNSGKGGDILYRWGNPQSYNRGGPRDQKYFGQHGAIWVKSGYPGEGNILVFNNGAGESERYSTVDEIIPPINESGLYEYIENQAYEPEEQIWIFKAENPQDMYSRITSNVQRLPNGNTLICASNQGHFLEVTNEKEVVWDYMNPYPIGFFNKGVARVQWYSENYPGLRFLT
jgi:hypothetical protein